jgi:hypothetical protein
VAPEVHTEGGRGERIGLRPGSNVEPGAFGVGAHKEANVFSFAAQHKYKLQAGGLVDFQNAASTKLIEFWFQGS